VLGWGKPQEVENDAADRAARNFVSGHQLLSRGKIVTVAPNVPSDVDETSHFTQNRNWL